MGSVAREVRLEIDPDDEACCLIYFGDQQLGGIMVDESGKGLRLILGNIDVGGGLQVRWNGGPISLRLDMSDGIAYLYGGQR